MPRASLVSSLVGAAIVIAAILAIAGCGRGSEAAEGQAATVAIGGSAAGPPDDGTGETAAAAGAKNLLSLSAGSVLIAHGGDSGGWWEAIYLFDGSPKSGWSSSKKMGPTGSFTLELPQTHELTSVAIDNSGVQERELPGISARSIEILASTSSPTEGFAHVMTVEAPKGARGVFPLPAGTQARWLKLVVKSNWGAAEYAEIGEIEGYGRPVGAAPSRRDVTGVYETNYGRLDLVQIGNTVLGCYFNGAGAITGVTDGRVLNLQWVQAGDRKTGPALLVLSAGSGHLNGIWYYQGRIGGSWLGPRRADAKPNCAGARTREAAIASALDTSGRAILYGVKFATDSDQITPDSVEVLKSAAKVLAAKPSLKVKVRGYTDSINTDAYNLDLSKRRAQAVATWLAAHGVDGARLTVEGLGEADPVADNATVQGRSLNRRVELAHAG